MPWQLAISIAVLATIVTSLVQRRHSQRSLAPSTFPPAISYLLGVMPLGVIVGLSLAHQVRWSWWLGLLLLIETVVMAFYNWLAFKAVRRLPVAQYQLIYQSYELVVIVLGWTLLSEGLSMAQSVGAALLFVGALIAIRAPVRRLSKDHRKVHTRAVLLALTAAVALGIGLVTEKAALGHMDIGGYLIFGYSAQTVGLLLLAAKDLRQETLKQLTKYEIKWSAIMGLANGVTGVFYVIAIVNSDNISLITALGAITLPLLALGAYVILKEREPETAVGRPSLWVPRIASERHSLAC